MPRLFAIAAKAHPRPFPGPVRPELERLEQRALPSGFGTLHPAVSITADIKADVADVKADATALTKALGSGVSSEVKADLKTLQTDIATLAKDQAAGKDLTKDLAAVKADLKDLAQDLRGSDLSHTARADLRDLRADVRDLAQDVAQSQGSGGGSSALADIKADSAELAKDLGSGVSSTVKADLKALDTALTKLATDFNAGKSITGDVKTVLQDEVKLVQDLGANIPTAAIPTLIDLGVDVVTLHHTSSSTGGGG
jgi:hypothetical protein